MNFKIYFERRSDREHVADDEHPDHQHRIDRWSTEPRWLRWLLMGLALSGVVLWLYAIVRLILFAMSWW
jgi:hypothetical protein